MDYHNTMITLWDFILPLLVLIPLFFFKKYKLAIIFSIITIIVISVSYLLSVDSYQLYSEKLIIRHPLNLFNRTISLSSIKKDSILPDSSINGATRLIGVGGVFGYYGLYSNKNLGKFRMYASRKKHLILIVLKKNEEKVVVTPDNIGMADTLKFKLFKYKEKN